MPKPVLAIDADVHLAGRGETVKIFKKMLDVKEDLTRDELIHMQVIHPLVFDSLCNSNVIFELSIHCMYCIILQSGSMSFCLFTYLLLYKHARWLVFSTTRCPSALRTARRSLKVYVSSVTHPISPLCAAGINNLSLT